MYHIFISFYLNLKLIRLWKLEFELEFRRELTKTTNQSTVSISWSDSITGSLIEVPHRNSAHLDSDYFSPRPFGRKMLKKIDYLDVFKEEIRQWRESFTANDKDF